jgi:hypothetical protein
VKASALVCLLAWAAAMVFIVIKAMRYKKAAEPGPEPEKQPQRAARKRPLPRPRPRKTGP